MSPFEIAILTGAIGLLGILLGSYITNRAQLKISEKERKDRFKLAALDKRLEVHQEALTLWWNLVGALTKPEERRKIAHECEEFWKKNCLYLEDKASDEFQTCYVLANLWDTCDKEDKKRIMGVGRYIFRAVELPSLAYKEIERIKKN